VLRAAGLDVPAVAPDVAESLGRILRVVVSGLMQVLRARQELKSEFRVEMTKYQPTENNPLRFSVDVEDALYNLLVKRHGGYLGPVAAFEDAFDDIRDHEVAMLAGMHAAFQMMLSHFEPDRLQEAFDRQIKESALVAVPGAARLRYWDMYRSKIRELVKDPETSFRELFGEEFASAYEEQLQRLKLRRRDARE
jgi:type VI secretion system FHA domain protein